MFALLMLSVALVAPVSAEAARFRLELPHDGDEIEISNDFGKWLNGRTHRGVDVFSPRGTAIVVVADGVVATMGHDTRPGWFISLDHDDGWRSLYLHLDGREPRWRGDDRGAETAFTPSLAVGDRVDVGDVIGFVGNSGNAARHPPHTHFELRSLGKPVDPYPLLMAAILASEIERAIEQGDSPYR